MNQMRDLRRICGVGGFERADRVGEIDVLFEEEFFVSGLDGADVFFWKTTALKTYQVHAAGAGWVSVHDHEGWHVLHHFRVAADDRVFSDAAELMHRRQAGNDGVIFDSDVPGEADGIGEDDVVAELAVMRDVRVAEQQIVRADARRQILMGAAMDRGVLAEDVVIADFEPGRLAEVFEILGFPTDGCEGEKLVAAPEFRVSFEHDMRMQDTLVAQLHIRADHAEGADADVVSKPGER